MVKVTVTVEIPNGKFCSDCKFLNGYGGEYQPKCNYLATPLRYEDYRNYPRRIIKNEKCPAYGV